LSWFNSVNTKAVVALFLSLAIQWSGTSHASSPKCVSLSSGIKTTSLFHAAVTAESDGSLEVLLPEVRNALAKIAEVEVERLLDPEVLEKLLGALSESIGQENYERAAGSQILSARSALDRSKHSRGSSWRGDRDKLNLNRGFGFKLLQDGDKAFRDPQFLADFAKHSRDVGDGYVGDNPTDADYKFRQAWKKVAPSNVEVMHFTATGTEANNSMYEVARLNHERYSQTRLNEDVELLYMEGIWGGTYGRIQKAHSIYKSGAIRPEFELPSPHSREWQPTDPIEIARLTEIENETLKLLEQRVKEGSKPIGGLIFEPILGAKGVYFFRTEFLIRLRILCDELRIPIIADEVLTGGGRTGKFFAYQHYQGFEPDYVTFGKGLLVSGVARVRRNSSSSPWGIDAYRGGTTIKFFLEPLLKSTQVLKRIHDDNLMQNAQDAGAYFLEKLKNYEPKSQYSSDDKNYSEPRGMGLLLWRGLYDGRAYGAMGRLLPYLTITKKEIDELFDK
jgi:acetylornithine/succinyldiaminopimelate/putrescine aminotransferase